MNPNDYRQGAQPVMPVFPPRPSHLAAGGSSSHGGGSEVPVAGGALWGSAGSASTASAPFCPAFPVSGAAPAHAPAVTGLGAGHRGGTSPRVPDAAYAEREGYANAAIQASAEFWMSEQTRRMTKEHSTGPERATLLEREAGSAGFENDQSTLEFLTGSPKYVFRVTLLLIVGLFGAIPLMSPFSLTVLLTGCVVTYVVDYAGYRRGSVLAIIGTAGSFGVALFLSNFRSALSCVGPFCMILSVQGMLVTTAMAAFLHFHWVQLSFPHLICLMERCVLGVTPLLTLPSLLSTITAFAGSRHTPAWFLGAMCAIHHFFYCPLESSFVLRRRRVPRRQAVVGGGDHMGGTGADRGVGSGGVADAKDEYEVSPVQINERPEAIIFTLLLLLLPTTIYVSFQGNLLEAWLTNLINTAGMLCVPIVYLCWDPERSLWFLLPERQALSGCADYDPLGVREAVNAYRMWVFVGCMAVLPNWGVYRLLSSRYRFLFNGQPPPLNGICLSVALYATIFAVVSVKKLLDADRRGESVITNVYLKVRFMAVGSAVVSGVFTGLAMGLPGPFLLLFLICMATINLYLLDRTNAGPLLSFTLFSSILLMWWMIRMFAFIVLDLHVLGETAVVPTPVLTVSISWCYVLSCLAFDCSFLESKLFFVSTLFTHSLLVAFVEHVLYSQKEDGVYPAILVLATSAAGVLLALRLYRNETISSSGASLIAGSYMAKLLTFLVEVTGSYYPTNEEEDFGMKLRGVEISAAWWAALFYGYIVMLFELERGKQMKGMTAVIFILVLAASAIVMVLCTIRNFQRAMYEYLTKSPITEQESVFVFVGISCILFGLLTYPFASRHLGTYAFMRRWSAIPRGSFVVGMVTLVSLTLRLGDNEEMEGFDKMSVDRSRYLTIVGTLLIACGKQLPLSSVHMVFRALYWLVITICLTVGLTLYLLPIPNTLLFCGIAGFVYFSLLTHDLAHYRETVTEALWIVYGISVCFVMFSIVVMGRLSVAEEEATEALRLWEIHMVGRRRLLSVACVSSLFTAILLRFRLSGKSLLPGAMPLTCDLGKHIGLVVNYAAILSVICLTTLNMWNHDYEPGLYVVTSLLLLLLVNDDTLFMDLDKGNFRYFPPLLYSVGLLWWCLVYSAYTSEESTVAGMTHALWKVLYALPLAPLHISLLSLTLTVRKSVGSSLVPAVIFSIVGLLVLLFSSEKTVQWMAIVGVCGQSARLLEAHILGYVADVL